MQRYGDFVLYRPPWKASHYPCSGWDRSSLLIAGATGIGACAAQETEEACRRDIVGSRAQPCRATAFRKEPIALDHHILAYRIDHDRSRPRSPVVAPAEAHSDRRSERAGEDTVYLPTAVRGIRAGPAQTACSPTNCIEQARRELERRLLEETGATETTPTKTQRRQVNSRPVALALAIIIPTVSGLLYWELGNPLAMTQPTAASVVCAREFRRCSSVR